MNAPVIRIRGLGKRYELNHGHRADSLKTWFKSLTGHQARHALPEREEFWALRDVNLDIHAGECLALVGKNGSGKSTLLKILSRIIPPSCGSVEIKGRVASLLEVGTGFHPELTGRENIFLNGAMLGCSEAEIRQRYDAIVSFSGVEKFIDTPVKHYSSGMYVRLAYSVAAHVNADILIIDEVLAVGDAEFQEKCKNHLSSLFSQGKTGILVSHDQLVVQALATQIVQLQQGQLVAI